MKGLSSSWYNHRAMRIGLTYDLQTDPQDERQAEFDPPRTIDGLCQALEALGHQVIRLGNAHELLETRPRGHGVDLVFNIAEGTHGRCREAWVPVLLDLLHIPYVGSDPLALSLGLDKTMSKRLAVASGIPTPRWVTVENPRRLPATIPLSFPVIVKPRYEGSGVGIDAGSVVQNVQALHERLAWLFRRVEQPLLVEEFIPFGELTVCLIGNDPPIAYPAIQRPIDSATRLSCHVVNPVPPRHRRGGVGAWYGAVGWETPLQLTPELDWEARRVALVMFEALGCSDMARVDLRVDEQGRVSFLEINPLPSFDPEGSFGLLAEHLGLSYSSLIGCILEAAQARLRRRVPRTVSHGAS